MRARILSFLSQFRRCESGQSTVLIAAMMIMLFGMTGFTIDVARAYYVYKELQATTDAAALAGASTIAAGTAVSTATQYSAVSGNKNARGSLPNVTMMTGYPKILCLTTLTTQGQSCSNAGGGNAVQVRQQIALPLTFMAVLGKTSLTLGSVATAAMKGSQRKPYNVAVIVDTTPSMNDTDSDSNCGDTRMNCAMSGVQVLLQNLTPCPPDQSSCGTATSGNYANAVDKVAMYTFPPLLNSSEVAHEYDCTGTVPKANNYTDPTLPIYKVVDYSSDYKTKPSDTTLNTSSNLVKAVHGKTGCTGMQALNNWTYVAGAMYAAGNDLINLQASDPSRQSVVVILTDGDMNAPSSVMPNASRSSGTYASTVKQCQQAVALAGLGATYNIKVYSVAYGATDSGCSTDNGAITPCQTVQQLASSAANFYSDYTATGGSSDCISAAHSTTGLNQIFQMIANDLSTSRLIPDNTT